RGASGPPSRPPPLSRPRRVLTSPPARGSSPGGPPGQLKGTVPMNHPILRSSRRGFLGALALGAAYFTTPGLFADELSRVKTPPQTEGPFYPDKLPLDTDNDLLVI